MALFIDHLKQVLRRLAKAPLFTAITLITLAVGIGANTVVFSVVEGVLLKPLNYPNSDRLIGIWHKAPGVNLPDVNMGAFQYFIYREQNTTFEDVGVYGGDSFAITGAGQPEHVHALDVTDGTLPLLGAKPIAGRLFARQDMTPQSAKTVILSWSYWQRRFGGDKSVIGRTLTVDGTAREIIGVLPRDFQSLDEEEDLIYVPIAWDRAKTQLGNFNYNGIARMKPGVTLEQASADIARMIPITIRSFPPPQGFSTAIFEKANFQPNLRTLKKVVIGDVGNTLWVLMGSIVLVLLVACANVANLLLVRVESRRQELAIRSALGAGRGAITLGLLLESAILGIAGSLMGLAAAFGALRILVAAAPAGLPRLHEISINIPVLLFTLGLAMFVSLVIGMIPVLKYSGIRASTGLRQGGRALSHSRERQRARKTLVVVQVGLAVVLLICSGLMIRTFRELARVSTGFDQAAPMQTFNIFIPDAQIPDSQKERVLRTEQAIQDKLASIPGVQAVAMATTIPLGGDTTFNPVYSADRVYKEGEMAPLRRFSFIGPGYFATVGTPLAAGRDVTWTEEYEKRPVALISENFAHEYWGSAQNAIGKRIRETPQEDWREIVGVARDVYYDGVDKPAPSVAYWPLYMDKFNGDELMMRRSVNYLIRSPRAGTAAFMGEVQRAVWSVDAELPLDSPTTMAVLYSHSMARTSFTLVILCVAGLMALLLGIVGIYGVISYAVSQNKREIGIRMALGAQRESLTAMYVRQGLELTAIGVVAGLAVAFASVRMMASVLYHVSAMDPWTYAAAVCCIVPIAWLACYLPSRRVAGVDPVDALRAE